MDAVRPLGAPNPAEPPAPPRRIVMLAPLVAAIAALAVLLAPSEAVEVSEADPPAPTVGEFDVEVVAEFHARLGVGDFAGAAAMVGPGATRLDLPGLPPGLLTGGATLATRLEELVVAIDGDAGECRSAPGRLTSGEVVCTLAPAGPWAEAVGLEGKAVNVTYRVADGQLADVVSRARPSLAGLCHWTEQSIGANVFDSDCRPLTGSGLAEAAEAYVAAGLPVPSDRYLTARRGARGVRLLVRAHNRSRDTAGMRAPGVPATGFPGLLGEGDPPPLGDYLRWSQVVYRIRLGTCSVDGSRLDLGLRVACPDARWTGPLVEGLALDPVPQPVTFTTRGAVVLGAAGGTQPGLASAFGRFCAWVYERRPEVAPYLFTEGCHPIFTADAAGRLLMTLSDYTDGAR